MTTKQPRKKQVKRTIKGWGITFKGKLLEASINRRTAEIEKARAQAQHAIILEIVPCTISYQLPHPKVK